MGLADFMFMHDAIQSGKVISGFTVTSRACFLLSLLLSVLSRLKHHLLIGALTLAGTSASVAADQSVNFDSIAQRAAPCMTCHGKEGRAANDGYYPRIAGKPAGYLYNQLVNFRDGRRRQYPLMIYMVQHLSDPYLQEIAAYFADQHPPYPPPQAFDVPKATLERGRALVHSGDASRNIPACIACHGDALTGVVPSIPGLLGLPRDYINSQFGAWKEGARRAAPPDCMGEIAKRLTPEDISAVSTWLASQPVPADATPAPSAARKLPLSCGSFSQ
jgi:cytochrome c553